MTEGKILENELLDDAELENVAGGTYPEGKADAEQLRKLGKYNFEPHFFPSEVATAIKNLGQELGVELKVRYSYHRDGNDNHYYIGNKEYTRENFWKFIDSLYAGK